MVAHCYEPENKRKCTEPERERMSGDLMELNDTDPNYINFGDETDSDNMIRMKTLCFKKACFILNSLAQFELLRVCQSEIFCTRKYNDYKISNVKFLCFFFLFFFFLTETFFYICVILILLKMSIFLELRFGRNLNIYKVSSFKVFIFKSFFW